MNDWNFFELNLNLNNLELNNCCIFAPDSKAQILYWFSRNDIPKQQKEDLIRALVNFDDDCGGFYQYRAYFLAAEALSYFPESSFGDAIVKQLLDWSYLYFGWQLFPQPLVEAARNTLQVTDKKRVIKAFECLMRNTPSRITLQSAATKLGELDSENKMANAALILLLDVATDNYRLSSICRSIGKIGSGNQAAINAVIKLMETTEDKNLCYAAIKTLGKIGCGNQTAIIALERFLQINRGDRICLSAAEALFLIDAGNQVAKDGLVFLLEKATAFLGEIAALLLQVKPEMQLEIIATLKNKIETSWDYYLVSGIADILNDFDFISEEAITALISIMENTLNKCICVHCINTLQIICSDKSVSTDIQRLVIDSLERFLIKNRGDDICLSAAEALWEIHPSNRIAISTLVEILQINRSFHIRERASFVLLRTSEHYEDAIQTLNEIANSYYQHEIHAPRYCVRELINNKIAMNSLAARRLIEKVITRLVSSFEFDEEYRAGNISFHYDDLHFLHDANFLKEILQHENFPLIITALKEYLGEKFYKSSSYRYDAVYKLIWHCAQNMSYQDFYQAWHG